MPKTYLNPDTLFPSQQYGFSQIVKSTGGTLVFISGQVAWDAQQNIDGGGDIGAQARQALHNLQIAVTTAGGTLADIVALRLYIVDYTSEKAPPITQALKDFFPADTAPTSTWIGVQALANEQFMIEIEATAVLEEK